MILVGIAMLVRTLVAGGGALASGSCWECCSSPRAPGGSTWHRGVHSRAPVNERPFSWRALFAVVYTTSVSSVYFALGIVGRHAGGLTPVVFLAGGIFFQLSAMTYAEGASLHRERGGSAVLARYAFNELVSFVAGWAIVLDYTILLAVTALTVPAYLSAFWAPLGRGGLEIAIAFGVIAYVAFDNLRGVVSGRLRRRIVVTFVDLALQAADHRSRAGAGAAPRTA